MYCADTNKMIKVSGVLFYKTSSHLHIVLLETLMFIKPSAENIILEGMKED